MWFRNLRIFRLKDWNHTAQQLQDALGRYEFQAGGSLDMESIGWAHINDSSGLVYAVDDQLLIKLRIERKLLPSAVINQFTKVKAQEIERQQGFRPGRKQLKEIKERVIDELLPKSFSIHNDTNIWIDTKNNWLVIDTANTTTADAAVSLLPKSLTPFPLAPIYVETAPAAAMNNWLVSGEPPTGFTVDQDTELRSTNESNAIVKYVRHSIDPTDVRKHIEHGKQCTRLALTWADRISFVLTDSLELRQVKPLDILKDDRNNQAETESEQFESDFTLMTGELSGLLDSLVDALGGEKHDH